ncbi:MAG TPA: hypothetical protein VFB37_12140, partial [Steroidobacteraceae bacterium]|nr:hypothetical protein [Steroidobacteraceae bacterium]
MRLILRRFAAVLVALATVMSLQPAGRALAQSGQSGQSPADLSGILQNLTPEQQQAILDRLSGGGGSGFGGLLGGGGQDQLGLGMRPGQQQLERKQPLSEEDQEEQEPLIPVMKADDWVIIEIDYRLGPRTIQPTAQALQALQL